LRPHAGPAASRRYERRRPEKTPLYKIVSECLEGWLADRSAREQPGAGMGATVTARKDAATRTTRR